MTRNWMIAALLSSAFAVSCADRAPEPGQTPEDERAAAEELREPAEQPSPAPEPSRPAPGQDTAAPRPQTQAPATRGTTPAPARPAQEPARTTQEVRAVRLPANTALPLELTTALSSETAKVETPVQARLSQAVMVEGITVLPAGAVLSGEVIDVERSGRVQGRARLAFRFTSVQVGGSRESLITNPITFEAEGTPGEDAAKIGTGAVGGAIVGGILGGGSGAARGAAIGGAAGTGVVLATRGREVELAPGTNLPATLAQPADIPVR